MRLKQNLPLVTLRPKTKLPVTKLHRIIKTLKDYRCCIDKHARDVQVGGKGDLA